MFGHKRGAFTVAISDRRGLFRVAGGGAVFLDEISEVSASFQTSLLRFVQEGEVKPLDSDHTTNCGVRELETEIRRMVALAKDGEYLTNHHLSKEIAALTPSQTNATKNGMLAIDGETLKDKVESLEKLLVSEALNRLRWNQSKVANELGLSRIGLANKIKRYDLHNI